MALSLSRRVYRQQCVSRAVDRDAMDMLSFMFCLGTVGTALINLFGWMVPSLWVTGSIVGLVVVAAVVVVVVGVIGLDCVGVGFDRIDRRPNFVGVNWITGRTTKWMDHRLVVVVGVAVAVQCLVRPDF